MKDLDGKELNHDSHSVMWFGNGWGTTESMIDYVMGLVEGNHLDRIREVRIRKEDDSLW